MTGGDVHGDVWARGARDDHAVNVATGGPPDWLRALLRRELDDALAAYPDETAAAEAIAFRHGRDPDEVVLLNGAAQGYALVARVLAPRRPAIVHPQFMEAERVLPGATRVVLGEPFALDGARVPTDADLVVVGNPTNPTGVLHRRADVRALGRTVLVDEAFMDFVPGEPETLAGGDRHGDGAGGDVIVLRSLTKILAVPGLRVGYLLAPPALARRLRNARPAWSVNAPALVVARAAALHPERLAPIVERARRDREALAAALRDLMKVHPGAAANFVLAELPGDGPDALTLATALRQDGIAIRPASTFPGLGSHHVRLTARGGAADARLVQALGRRAVQGTPA
ncbi:MAG TPA: aminotransferase class I/II-fold pyridoxal phosphate-dependent enzyme [Baekduia sp.]|uniref:aminotransferase class I/II-fold pyridoxal phosphate-dependent enzyme n=1 Tax=Baekduia sp. TaxID=2600305 RepID=UPI002D76B229|nr:aminotransferase class I/II-fold pyridoxal phosphate-dependent enzyme [Baekduia sp.]HET6505678.1 aminotransferase class I/II-fold pyridoxal phosphate-dependent enzyme [Baekduia sp.]